MFSKNFFFFFSKNLYLHLILYLYFYMLSKVLVGYFFLCDVISNRGLETRRVVSFSKDMKCCTINVHLIYSILEVLPFLP